MRLRYFILPSLFVLILGLSFFVYFQIYGLAWDQALFYALDIFTLDLKSPGEIGDLLNNKDSVMAKGQWQWIYVAGIASAVFAASSLALILLKLFEQNVKDIYRRKNGSELLVFGLSKDNRILIDSYLRQKGHGSIIVIEKSSDSSYIEEYKRKKVTVFLGNQKSKRLLDKLNFKKTKYILASTLSDLDNIEIALQCTRIIGETHASRTGPRILLRIENRNLRNFHKDNGLFISSKNVDIYSKNENIARSMFDEYAVDSIEPGFICGDKAYSMILIGNTPLSIEIIYQALLMAQLPNRNRLTIYCVSEDAMAFRKKVRLMYPELEKLHETTVFKFVSVDFSDLKSYQYAFWTQDENLANIILAEEDSLTNLDIAAHLSDITYKDAIVESKFKTRLLVGVYDSKTLKNMVDANSGYYRSFYIFGDNYHTNHVKRVLKDDRETIAKCIDQIYEKIKNVENDKIEYHETPPIYTVEYELFWKYDSKWSARSHFKKESNRSVADHLDVKLRYMGLKKHKSEKDYRSCLKTNIEHFANKYDAVKDLLAENEHTRWNVFHYLHGYQKTDYVDKETKGTVKYKLSAENKRIHMCLRPFDELRRDEPKLSGELGYDPNQHIQYDYMINYFIPYVLAAAGYEISLCDICENDEKALKIGVTGHRILKNKKQIREVSVLAITKLSEAYRIDRIISPLAEGSDRMIAEVLTQDFGAKLIVPLPFEKVEYIKDFSEKSKRKFESCLEHSVCTYEVSSLKKETREEGYMRVGREIVDKSDLIVALWNGEEAKGAGGTGDVVDYAKKKGKTILHIDTNTLAVEYINFEGLL